MAAILALILGSLVLLLPKGDKLHFIAGRIYAGSMLLLLVTAFMIFNLFGRWGIFHWAAVVSTLTLMCGMIPVIVKMPKPHYLSLHMSFMCWSVMGLYAAFLSEIFVRIPTMALQGGIPDKIFYNMAGLGSGIVMGIAVYYFLKLKPGWDKSFQS